MVQAPEDTQQYACSTCALLPVYLQQPSVLLPVCLQHSQTRAGLQQRGGPHSSTILAAARQQITIRAKDATYCMLCGASWSALSKCHHPHCVLLTIDTPSHSYVLLSLLSLLLLRYRCLLWAPFPLSVLPP